MSIPSNVLFVTAYHYQCQYPYLFFFLLFYLSINPHVFLLFSFFFASFYLSMNRSIHKCINPSIVYHKVIHLYLFPHHSYNLLFLFLIHLSISDQPIISLSLYCVLKSIEHISRYIKLLIRFFFHTTHIYLSKGVEHNYTLVFFFTIVFLVFHGFFVSYYSVTS